MFGGGEEVRASEQKISKLEQMLGQKEVGLALLKIFRRALSLDEKVQMVKQNRDCYGLNR